MDDYYREQAGSGIGGFAGVRYQKGHGFLGRFVSNTALPILKKVLPFLGQTALATGSEILSDISKGEDFKSSAKKRLTQTGKMLGAKALSKVKQLTGEGKRRRRTRSTKRSRKVKRAPRVAKRKISKPKRRRRRKKQTKKSKSRRKSASKSAKDFV